jgi:hypothetical protein
MKFRIFWDVGDEFEFIYIPYILSRLIPLDTEQDGPNDGGNSLRTSGTSVNFNMATRRYIPEDSKRHYGIFVFERF